MIYLITGTPGAGKTLYAISTLVKELMAKPLLRHGKQVQRRLLVDGVPGLLLPHVKLSDGKESEDGTLHPGDGCGIWNWWQWCQPGDVIFVDEVQRWFRPRGLGTKVPPEIKHLETHRHLGVDFVFVTQSPMLIDQNIRRLVYRHQHIRRLWGMPRAVIYEWDGCAENVKSTKAATLKYFNYPRSAYDLYKSSELHTRPKTTVPVWAFLPVIALIGLLAVAPKVVTTMSNAMTGKGIVAAEQKQNDRGTEKKPEVASKPAPLVASAASAPVQDLRQEFSGCYITSRKDCICLTTDGKRVDMNVEMCADLVKPRPNTGQYPAFSELPRARDLTPEEIDVYSYFASRRTSSAVVQQVTPSDVTAAFR